MIESNIIYNFEDFRTLVSSKAKEGSYYLLYDDLYFEKIDKNTMITREAYTVAGRYTKSFNIIKYISFKVKDDYTTKEIAEFIELLRKHTTILLTIFNPKKKDCFLLFISNKEDSQLEREIKNLLEMEE
ncbi:hypothetical protein [uncultured Clostridium sp.]|uniref:hypothetical protein n=1 Tax=uncultured Clostridium sp. TaxID=59620 RepID=UPI00262A0534|nr:hypothetical protein [uncultured Clostridium sp.]MCI8310153.1 hypothetical protein [Clostridia bacterium]